MTTLVRFSLGERQVVLIMILLSLVAHAGAFYIFRVTDKVRMPALSERPRVQWMRPPSLEREGAMPLQYVVAETLDPSLMSLPSARGFSRQMWEKGMTVTHRASEWTVEPAYLDVKLAAAMPPLLEQPSLVEQVKATVGKRPAVSEEPVAEAVEVPVVLNQSVFRVAGPLAGRPVVRVPKLPVIPSVAPVRSTTVRAGVGADGVVRFATVEKSSGNEDVDNQAVTLTRQIRFEPQGTRDIRGSEISEDSISWGLVKFLWATQPSAAPPGSEGARP